MAWYRTGTVSVTNGSTTVTGAGTSFVSNVVEGEGFLGPDGRVYEIAAVVSATQLTLAAVYQGSTASAQAYAILPTQSALADLAAEAAELVSSFAAVRDGAGQGMFGDGTAAAPGIRFSADQDTGLYRPTTNELGVAIAGALAARWASNAFTLGSGGSQYTLSLNGSATVGAGMRFQRNGANHAFFGDVAAALGTGSGAIIFTYGAEPIRFYTNGAERAQISGAGAFSVAGAFSATGVITTTAAGGFALGSTSGVARISHASDIFYFSTAANASASIAPGSATTASAANVHQASSGSALLRSTSSLRYKTSVETVDPAFNRALDLRPVWYRSLAEADPADFGYWGLIAEEVAQIDPRLVHYAFQEDQYEDVEVDPAQPAVLDEEGNEIEPARDAVFEQRVKAGEVKRPDGVQYERLAVLLLDVAQRQHAKLASQQEQMDALEARLTALEAA